MSTGLVLPYPALGPAPGRDWPAFWGEVYRLLRSYGYTRGTLSLYRSVLRALARHSGLGPEDIDAGHIRRYLVKLARSRCSAGWLAMNISVLRTVFDKLCGTDFLEGRRGPRRPHRLPSTLSEEQVSDLLQTCRCPRDALLAGLLYGCGLKTGEAVQLTWGAVDLEAGVLRVRGRELPLPRACRPLLEAGVQAAGPEDYLFCGRRPGTRLNQRSVSRIIGEAALAAGLDSTVCPTTLRNSFAAHLLAGGANVRKVQAWLGHRSVLTTLRYRSCLPPEHDNPLDRLVAAENRTSQPERAGLPEASAAGSEPLWGGGDRRAWLFAWLRNRLIRVVAPSGPSPG